jgi:hypothetical protein
MDQDTITGQNADIARNNDLVKIESMLKSITETVAAQKLYLEKHTAAMEKLTLAIKQLDQTLKKEINLESRQTSTQLEELVKLFVEYEINPEYYHEHKMLKAASVSQSTQLVRHKPVRKPRRDGSP